MAVVGGCKELLLLLFMIFVTAEVSEIYGQTVKSLSVAPRDENTNIHIFETNLAPDSTGVWKSNNLAGHNLYKRSAVLETNITTHVSLYFCVRFDVLCVICV
jgi:hypothetical protein